MKLDNIIIPVEPPAILAEASQRKLGKYNVLGTWGARIAISSSDFKTTMGREIDTRPCAPLIAADADWGEQDSLANVPRGMPVSIKLVLNPELAQEGDE